MTSHLGKLLSNSKPPSYSGAVRWSSDFERISRLTRLTPIADEYGNWLAREWTNTLKRPGGTMSLRPIQAMAVEAMHEGVNCMTDKGGALLPLGVGKGKTLIGFLAGQVYRAKRPVLMTFANLVAKTMGDYVELSKHWTFPKPTIVTWEDLSSVQGAEYLNDLQPDLIVADECHAVKSLTSSRTIRFLRYFEEHPTTILVAMSGTLTSNSLRDFAHIAKLCLGQDSPVPFEPRELNDWCLAIDATLPKGARRKHPGILTQWTAEGQSVREAYRERLVSAPGVVASTDSALGTALNITRSSSFACDAIKQALREFDASGQWGDECTDSPLDFARIAKTLACGYWLEWQWPSEPDVDWLLSRNSWARHCRYWITYRARVGFDSPALLAKACLENAPEVRGTDLAAAWEQWAPHRHKPAPPVKARFIPGAIQGFAAAVKGWTERQSARSITWVPSPHLGAEIARLTGLPWCAAENELPKHKPDHILLSEAFATGHNLQEYSANLVLVPPASGQAWEQLLGRTHRPGQTADSVECTVLQHHSTLVNALRTARSEAKYIEETTGNRQKLCLATWV